MALVSAKIQPALLGQPLVPRIWARAFWHARRSLWHRVLPLISVREPDFGSSVH